jgi:hypothetical protein
MGLIDAALNAGTKVAISPMAETTITTAHKSMHPPVALDTRSSSPSVQFQKPKADQQQARSLFRMKPWRKNESLPQQEYRHAS